MDSVITILDMTGKAFVDFAGVMLIQSSVLIVLLLGVDWVLRKRVRAVFRYCIWMLVLVKLVLPTTLSSPTGLGQLFGDKLSVVAKEEAVIVERAAIVSPSPRIELSDEAVPVLPKADVAASPLISITQEPVVGTPAEPVTLPSSAMVSLSWQGFVFLGWLAAVAAMVLLLVQRMFFVRGLLAQSKAPSDSMIDAFQQCQQQMKIRGKVNLKLSPVAASPAVCGLFRPTVLIPQNLPSKLNREDLRSILLHELAHIKRGDLWVSLVQTVLQIGYFYNPLLWAANAIIRKVREQAVDEMVLVAMGERAEDYPETLLNISRLTFSRPVLSLRLIGVVESKKALTGRIKHILSRPFPKTAKLGFLGLIAILLTAAVLLPMAKAEKDRIQNTGDSSQERSEFKATLPNGVTVEQVVKRADSEARLLNHEYIGTEHILLALASADSVEENKATEVAEVTENSDFKATLPNGVTVELVGVCDYPENKPRCWQPDGTDLKDKLYVKREKDYSDGKFGFILKVTGPENLSFPWNKIEGSEGWWGSCEVLNEKGSVLEGYEAAITEGYDGRDTTDIRVGAATGQWKTIIEYDGSLGGFVGPNDIVFSKPIEAKQGTTIAVRGEWGWEGERRIIAVDKNGNTHTGGWSGRSTGLKTLATTEFYDLKPEQIQKYELQFRPYERVEFKNVSLKPGFETDVEIKVESKEYRTTDEIDSIEQQMQEHLAKLESLTVETLQEQLDLVRQTLTTEFELARSQLPSESVKKQFDEQIKEAMREFDKEIESIKKEVENDINNEAEVKMRARAVSDLIPPGRYALEFDGEGDYLEIQASESLKLGRHFTVQMWIKPEFPDTGTPDKDRNLLSKGGYVLGDPDEKGGRQAGTYGFGFRLRDEDNSRVALDMVTANGGTYASTVIFKYDSGWHHLAICSRESGGASRGIYYISTSEKSYEPAPLSNIIVGGMGIIPMGNHFKGQIGEVRIWNRELSSEEIARYKGIVLTGNEPNLVGCWTFEEGEGRLARDISPYRNRAWLRSSYAADKSGPTWVHIGDENKSETDVQVEVEKPTVFKFDPVVEITINDNVAVGKNSNIDFDTGRLFPRPENWQQLSDDDWQRWIEKTGVDASGATRSTVRGLMCEGMVFIPMTNSYWDKFRADSLAASDLWKMGKPGRPAYMSAQGQLPVTYMFKTREGGIGILQITGFNDKPKGVKLRYKMLQKPQNTEKPKDVELSLFESYFPDDEEAGGRLTEWWENKDSMYLDDESFFELFRRGLRTCTIKYRGNFPMQHIGGQYIWHKEPDDQRAIDIVYHASFSPEFKYYAVYSGLSTANPKSERVLRRLVDIALEPHQLGRILWGVKQSKQEEAFMTFLEPYLRDGDLEKRERAEIVAKALRGEIDAGKWERQYHQNQAAERTIREFGDDLERIRKTFLTGSSEERKQAFGFIGRNKIVLYHDRTFIAALAKCAEDENADVRAQTASLLGGSYIWGQSTEPNEAIETLLQLARDENRQVRKNAVYYGLSVVNNKSEAVIKQLIEMAVDEAALNDFGRISWGLGRGADKEIIKEYLRPYLDIESRKGELARVLYRNIFNEEPPGE